MSNLSLRASLYSVLVAVVVFLSGCAGTNVRMECTVEVEYEPESLGSSLASAGNGYTANVQTTFENIPAAGFDMSNVHGEIEVNNAQLASYSGNLTVKVVRNGNVVASREFGYYLSGSALMPSDPAAANAWLDNQTQAGDDIIVDAEVAMTSSAPQGSTASIETSAVSSGTSVASTSTTWTVTGGGGGACNDPSIYCKIK